MRTASRAGPADPYLERRHLMTADQLKRKFRNFPEAYLRLRIATA
jgi:hypothetical protein